MTREPRLPRLARWVLRLSPVPRDSRDEVQSHLLELFTERRHDRGRLHAHWRLCQDVASLWREPGAVMRGAPRRPPFAMLGDARADLAFALRLLARQPAIMLLTILGMSLGLGISTGAFSIMNAALRGEGLVDSSRLPGVLRVTDRSMATVWTYDEFLRLREGATRMQVEAVLTGTTVARTAPAGSDAPATEVAFVSDGFFTATGAHVAMGRPLDPADEQRVGPPPVVLSFLFWTSQLNQDPSVVGRTIRVGRTDATVVGVADREFSAPHHRAIWMPLTAYGAVYEAAPAARAPRAGIQVFGRLLPGVSLAEAEAQMSAVAAALPRTGAADDSALRVTLDPHAGLGRMSRAERSSVTLFVSVVIALVLLLACANAASVLVSAAITREREMGVRAALGASRSRLVRQLITESLLLGAIAAGVGLMMAYWAIPVMGTMIEAPAGVDLAPDLKVFLFLGIVTIASGVGAGLAPAWHGRGADLVTPLNGSDGARHNRVAPRRMRSILVMAQAAGSVLLIVLATLFVRATVRAAAVDVGFEADGLYAVSPGLGDPFAPDGGRTRAFWARALPALQTVAGVRAAALALPGPFSGISASSTTHETPARVVALNATRSEYFETLGVRMRAGRAYTRAEVEAGAPVAVISESLARAYFHDQSPLGQLLPALIPLAGTRPVIIGVTGDAIAAQLHERNTLAIYQPLDPASEQLAELLIRVEPGMTGVIDQASQRLRAVDPEANITVTSIAARLRQEAGRPRMLAALTGAVGAIAMLLCVIGLYGLTASVVGQRSREMAVRAAIGADSRDLLRLLMWDSLKPVAIGLVAGTAVALLAGRVLAAAVFFGVSPQDPVALAGATAILLVAAILAVLVPTWRAAKVDAALVLKGA